MLSDKRWWKKLLWETEVDSFTNIKTLKETTDKMGKFYMCKMNCESVSGEPSYIFKTSTKALEIAKKKWNKKKLKDSLPIAYH